MFLPHCHLHTFHTTPCSLQDSLLFAAAFVAEREVTDSCRKRLNKSYYYRDRERIEVERQGFTR